MQRELQRLRASEVSTDCTRHLGPHKLRRYDDDAGPVQRLLCLGMVFLVSHLGPHKRLSAGVLLPAAGRPRTGLGSRFRLDQYLHLAVRGPAPAATAASFEHHEQFLDDHQPTDHELEHKHVTIAVQSMPMRVAMGRSIRLDALLRLHVRRLLQQLQLSDTPWFWVSA